MLPAERGAYSSDAYAALALRVNRSSYMIAKWFIASRQ